MLLHTITNFVKRLQKFPIHKHLNSLYQKYLYYNNLEVNLPKSSNHLLWFHENNFIDSTSKYWKFLYLKIILC